VCNTANFCELSLSRTKPPRQRGCMNSRKRQMYWFVALRCCAEECAISLSTQAQGSVWDLAEYKRVKPAHCPTGATSGGTGGKRNLLWAYHPLCFIVRRFVRTCLGLVQIVRVCVYADVFIQGVPLYTNHLPEFVGEKVRADYKLMMIPTSLLPFHSHQARF
jgi:hypothetical protein